MGNGRSEKMGTAFDKRGLISRGPADADRSRTDPTPSSDLLVPVFTPRQRLVHWFFFAGWVAALALLWWWWLQPAHKLDTFWFVVNSAVLGWVTLMPGYLLLVLGRGRVPNPAISLPPGQRVAMVVTKVPSEPWPMVRRTLVAMLRQPYPHDTWLADEDPSGETVAWCAEHSVSISSRRGCADYHRAEWPRRTRCKEGNLAYFYDHYGYRLYDFVVQLDADHVPDETYLDEMLRPFVDPTVGYVSAPSICDQNAAASWSARSRLYAEGMLHGGLQVGYNGGLAPLCFGSHYAVRTKALQEIGGLGPELAEDHSTTLLMNAHGWRGVHAVNAIAHGDGPETFADLATQEFQWSRSLTTILLRYSPRYLGALSWRLKLQFLFCQSWYALFSIMMAISYTLPLIAIVNNRSMVDVTYLDFMIRYHLVTVVLIAMGFWWRRNGWARPRDARALSWEGAIFLMARWPWSLLGVAAGVANVLSGREANFRITPKGSYTRAKVPFQVMLPYFLLSLVSSWCVLSVDSAAVRGYYIFASINAIFYALVLTIIVGMHWAEAKHSTNGIPGRRVFGALRLGDCNRIMGAAAVLLLALIGVVQRGSQGAEFLLAGADRILGDSSRFSGHKITTTKRVAVEIAQTFGEIKPGVPVTSLRWDIRIPNLDNTLALNGTSGSDSFGSGLPTTGVDDTSQTANDEWSQVYSLQDEPRPATASATPPDASRPIETSRQFRSASLRWPRHQFQLHRSGSGVGRPTIVRFASHAAIAGSAYTRHFLNALGNLLSSSPLPRSGHRHHTKG